MLERLDSRNRLCIPVVDSASSVPFSLKRWWEGVRHGDWDAAFRGNYSQRDKMAEVRKLFKQYPDLRASVRNLTSLRQGAPVDVEIKTEGKARVFQALYPDKALSQRCADCHNVHPKSPKRDFKAGDVMGGILLTIPLPK